MQFTHQSPNNTVKPGGAGATAPTGPTGGGNGGRPSLSRVLPLLVILAGFVVAFATGLHQHLSFDTLAEHRQVIRAWTADNYILSVAAFVGIYYVAVMFSLPGAVWMTLTGGFLFGTAAATAYVVVAATAGATAIFLAARYALSDYFHAKAGPAVRRMEAGFRDDALSYLLVLRLVPLFPFWLVNLVPALLGVRLRTYVFATAVGIVPGAFVYAGVGSGLGAVFDQGGTPDLGIIFEPDVFAPLLGLAALALIPVAYKRRRRRGADNGGQTS